MHSQTGFVRVLKYFDGFRGMLLDESCETLDTHVLLFDRQNLSTIGGEVGTRVVTSDQ